MDFFTYAVQVGYTTSRPVVPDQHYSKVVLVAADDTSATLLAAQLVASRPGVEMPTSTTILSVIM